MRLSIYERQLVEIATLTREQLLPALKEALEVASRSSKTWRTWAETPIIADRLRLYLMVAYTSKEVYGPMDTAQYCNEIVLGVEGGRLILDHEATKVLPEFDSGSWNEKDYSESNVQAVLAALRRFDRAKFLTSCEDSLLSN